MIIIIGSKIVISTSKIKKITAIKKKWRENGIRGYDFGSNPHSNGDLFSRSLNDFFEIILAIIMIMEDTPTKINPLYVIKSIIYTKMN